MRTPVTKDYSQLVSLTNERRVVLYDSNSKNHWCGASPTDTGPILYLSGGLGQMKYTKLLLDLGCMTRCLSFTYLCGIGVARGDHQMVLHHCMSQGRSFLDSGAFTLQKQKADMAAIMEHAVAYRDYIGQTLGFWDWYAGLDYERNVKVVWEMQGELQKLGLRPTPVYHGDGSFDYLERYCKEGYGLVAIARPRGFDVDHYYDRCFEIAARYGTQLHGFQQTGKHMFKYPWWSVDSSTWLVGGTQGSILHYDPIQAMFVAVSMTQGKNESSLRYWKLMPSDFRQRTLDNAARFGLTEKGLIGSYFARCYYNQAVMYEAIEARKARGDMKAAAWKAII